MTGESAASEYSVQRRNRHRLLIHYEDLRLEQYFNITGKDYHRSGSDCVRDGELPEATRVCDRARRQPL